LRSLSGVKRTSRFALHMSAYDPKQTLALLNIVVMSAQKRGGLKFVCSFNGRVLGR
jgi:hypothetical protein